MRKDHSDRVDLRLADPESRDSGYWSRFHRGVMASASATLSARGRRVVPVSFTDLVLQWGRAAVPLAAAAAMLAGLTLMNDSEFPTAEPIALEDVLSHGPDGVDLTSLSLQDSREPAATVVAEW